MRARRLLAVVATAASALLAGACGGTTPASSDVAGGDPLRGEELFAEVGCGSCHRLDRADDADGVAGPPLDDFAARLYIAGSLENTPEELVRWLRSPQSVEPGTAMPDLGLSERQARHLAAYLRAGG